LSRKLIYAQIDQKLYPVKITFKPMKHIRAHFREGAFYISAPKKMMSTPEKVLTLLGYQRLTRLINRSPSPLTEDEIYLFGTLVNRDQIPDLNQNSFPDTYPQSLKKQLLDYLQTRVSQIKKQMHITADYTIVVRDMQTRYGSISKKTNRISFASKLIHFAPEIIDSVIYHELAHLAHFDHGEDFYRHLLRYCPKYKQLRKALIHHQYHL
jgi:predicted metal-dependent hydrolase